ncbi:hypothetical protein, partial [Lactococcus lactis]|uniref:hypothetical protein n=1 Tax=Lactococcus lactis TaxID=1358 RepID=UPI001966DF35
GCLPKLAVGLGDFRLPKWGFRPKPQASKKDSFLSLLFLFFSQVAQAQKSSAGNFIESILCGGSAVLVSRTSYSEREIVRLQKVSTSN